MEELKRDWYAVSTAPGRERKVKESLEARATTMGVEEYFHKVVLVEQPEIDIKRGKKVEIMKNLFPGYLFVDVTMTDEVWYVIRNTPGVTGFIGSSVKGAKPIPVKDSDMLNVLALAGETDNKLQNFSFKIGELVKILTGPFASMEGKIISLNEEKQSANIEIILFGRKTDATVEYSNLNHIE